MEGGTKESYGCASPTFSETSGKSSDAFSDFSSEGSGDLAPATETEQRIRASTSAESNCPEALVHALVSDLESNSVDLQLKAATTIRLLAIENNENRLKFVRAGSIRHLVTLISSPHRQIQEQSVTAMLNLSLRDDIRDEIASFGAISALARALKNGTAVCRENSAFALLRLGQIEDHKLAIGRSGSIPLLVNMLSTGSLRGKKDASAALYAICSKRENSIRALQAGIVRPLLELAADQDSGMVDKAIFLLCAIAVFSEARAAVVEEGGVPVLVEFLEVGSQFQKEIVVSVLLQICEQSAVYRAMVAREGALPPLVALSRAGTSKARKKAERLIGMLRQARAGNGRYTVADESGY